MAELCPCLLVSAWQSSRRTRGPAAATFADTEAVGCAAEHLCSEQAEPQVATSTAIAASSVQESVATVAVAEAA